MMRKNQPAYYLYAALLYLLLIILLPLILLAALFSGRARYELKSRVFDAFKVDIAKRKGLPTIWIHASSIGEMKVAERLIEEIRKKGDVNVALSIYTHTAYEKGKSIQGLSGFFLLPLDVPCLMDRIAKGIRPDLLIIIESELWPSLLHAARKQGAAIALVNGRISEKAFANHLKTPVFIQTSLAYFDLLLARSEEDAERLQHFAGEEKQIKILGNIKYDISSSKNNNLINILTPENTYICLASTRNGEEELLLESISRYRNEFFQNRSLKFVLAPRHVDRVAEVRSLLERYSFRYVLYSEERPLTDEEFLLVDVFGVLNDCFQGALGTFIGGSLVAKGGQNLLEPISLGVPVIFGPDMSNFKEEARYFLKHGAIQAANAGEVVGVFRQWLDKPEQAKNTGENLLKALDTHRGVVEKYVEELYPLIG